MITRKVYFPEEPEAKQYKKLVKECQPMIDEWDKIKAKIKK
jgi:hypothetical protein